MPEAAEVGVLADQLRQVLPGRRIEAIVVTHPRTVRHTSPDALDAVVGHEVAAVERHGKWLLLRFDGNPLGLGVHLRMSGQVLAMPASVPPVRHVHARFRIGPRSPSKAVAAPSTGAPQPPRGAPGTGPGAFELWFRDPRIFGELRPMRFAPVAPDLTDPLVTGDALRSASTRRGVGVKAVLLEQDRVVAGVGSYLADEVLHRCGICPTRPAKDLATSEWAAVLEALRVLVAASTARGGVTLADEGWVDLWGRPGSAASLLQVHARAVCGTCGTSTRTEIVGGRRARWCPRCQPD